jgi:hypothetical protein
MLDSLKQIFLMTWLWSIFAGFYLVAYAFWVPRLFSSLPVIVLVILVTLALGGTVLADGFSRALQLQTGASPKAFPFVRARQLVGGLVLLAYLSVYLPPGGRIVAHWPLDLAITVLSGVILVVYAIANK